jgi:hypothetical protein
MSLMIGTTPDGKPFTLPADLGDKKIALLAQSKKGKTYGLGDILEELAKAQRPFIATDPANNLWGLRVLPDGSPSDLRVVVIGGDHGDIPFEKDAGERMAEALLATPICAVIDISLESLGSVRRFMTDFAGRLKRSKPEIPRVVVLEEAPVLIPQKARGPQMEACKSAVSWLATIGGNFGYGVIVASQRAATIDKDVLSQCEALIVMGMTHEADRDTVRGWMKSKDLGSLAEQSFNELGSLKAGEAWLWWPSEDRFEKFTFRKRETLHPREMQKLGLKAGQVQLGDMQAFVERMNRDLTRTSSAVPADVSGQPGKVKRSRAGGDRAGVAALPAESAKADPHVARQINDQSRRIMALTKDLEDLMTENKRLQENLAVEVRLRRDAVLRLDAVRAHLRPQFDALRKLFGEIGEASPAAANGEIGEAWTQWLEKAAKIGAAKSLEILVRRGRLTQKQLATLAGLSIKGGHWARCRSFMTKNSLATLDGEYIVRAEL